MVAFSRVDFENFSSLPIKHKQAGILTMLAFSIQEFFTILQLNCIRFLQKHFLCKYTVQTWGVNTLAPFTLGQITF